MCPVSRQLAASGLAQATLSVVVVWPGDLLSGCLHQDAAEMELAWRSFSFLMLHRCSCMLGSKDPLHGTNINITV